MPDAVVDCSVVVKWVFPEPETPAAVALRHELERAGAVLYAPDFLFVELANVAWKKGIFRAVSHFPSQLEELIETFTVIPSLQVLRPACEIAHQYRISIYDALYVALALAHQVPFHTADRSLHAKLQGSELRVELLRS